MSNVEASDLKLIYHYFKSLLSDHSEDSEWPSQDSQITITVGRRHPQRNTTLHAKGPPMSRLRKGPSGAKEGLTVAPLPEVYIDKRFDWIGKILLDELKLSRPLKPQCLRSADSISDKYSNPLVQNVRAADSAT
jgi:hypothetical protein